MNNIFKHRVVYSSERSIEKVALQNKQKLLGNWTLSYNLLEIIVKINKSFENTRSATSSRFFRGSK